MNFNNNYYFLRHAQTDRSKKYPLGENPLTEKGLDQARAIVSSLEGLTFDIIYSSPFKRTMDTIAPFLEQSDYKITH